MWVGKLLLIIMALNAFWFIFCYAANRVGKCRQRKRLSASNKLNRKG